MFLEKKTFVGQSILILYKGFKVFRVYRYVATSAKHFFFANTAVDNVVKDT